jgi:hypothetical protein
MSRLIKVTAAGDLVTSARGLFLWDMGMREEKILSPESAALLYRPIPPDIIFTTGGPLLILKNDGGAKNIRLNRLSASSTRMSRYSLGAICRGPAENLPPPLETPCPQKYSARSSAAMRATCWKTWEGGGV